jgi:zona occludens toxin
MIRLFTGIPGSSKTLNAVKELIEDDLYQNRPIYYYNVQEVVFDDWIELSESEVLKWYELPVGSIIFIDECQKIFRPRKPGDKVPAHVEHLETHRHDGFDLILTTQHPMLIDTALRRQVGEHWHFERKFGFERARVLKWQECQNDPKDYHCRQEAIVSNDKFPKKYYGTYKSAEIHTVKKKIPAKLYMLALFICLFLAGAAHFTLKLTGRADALQAAAVAPEPTLLDRAVKQVSPATPAAFQPKYPLDPQKYLALFEPRLDGQPNTAPIYDNLMEPTVAPQRHCLIIHKKSGDECRCYTQQATKINISATKCLRIVQDGMFDHVRQIASITYNSEGKKLSTSLE